MFEFRVFRLVVAETVRQCHPSSPAWHRRERRRRVQARERLREGGASLRDWELVQENHGSGVTMTNAWCSKCRSWRWIGVSLPLSEVTWCQTGPGICSHPRSRCESGHRLKGVAPEYAAEPRAVTLGVDCCPRRGGELSGGASTRSNKRCRPWIRYTSRWRSFRVPSRGLQSSWRTSARPPTRPWSNGGRRRSISTNCTKMQHQVSVLASKKRVLPDDSDMDEDQFENGWYHDGSGTPDLNGGWQVREWYSGNGGRKAPIVRRGAAVVGARPAAAVSCPGYSARDPTASDVSKSPRVRMP